MNILRIDMSALSSSSEDLPEKWKAIGGRGLSAEILNAEVSPTVDPLGSEAKLVIAMGPLAGTMAPSFGRISVGAKSPLTQGIKEANVGGSAGQMLDKLGCRAIVVEGAAADGKLHVVKVSKDGVSFEDGEAYRGMGNYELVAALYEKHGKKVSIISIGPIGERLQTGASVAVTDKDGHPSRHAARGGLGAVMGSKGLKAIVVDDAGTKAPEMADKKAYQAAIKAWPEKLKADGQYKMMHNLGTPGLISMLSKFSSMPSKNFTGEPTEGVENLFGEALKEKNTARGGRMDRCMPGCLVECSIVYHDADGKHVTSGLEYETFGLMGTNLGVADLDAIAGWERRCDNMGIDTIELGSALGVAASAGKFAMGDVEAVSKLIAEVEEGTEFGATLANGVVATAKALGVTRIPAYKGQGIPAHDPRIGKPTGVTYATSPMGADHTAGIKYEMADEGAVEHSLREQIVAALIDSVGLCNFAVTGDRQILMDFIKDIMNAHLGLSLTADDVVNIGRDCLRAEVKFNDAAGFNALHEVMPQFVRTEGLLPAGALFGVKQEEMDDIWSNLDSISVL